MKAGDVVKVYETDQFGSVKRIYKLTIGQKVEWKYNNEMITVIDYDRISQWVSIKLDDGTIQTVRWQTLKGLEKAW